MLQRIRQIVDEVFKGNKSEFARSIGVGESSIRSYLSGTIPKADVLEKIIYNTSVSCEWLLSGNGDMLNKDTIQLSKPNIEHKFSLRSDNSLEEQRIPLYELDASAGIVSLFGGSSKLVPTDYITIPNIPKCDGAMHVAGDSMYPILKSGDIVMYKEVTDILNDIFWGEMYIISFNVDGEEYVTIKYVQKSEIEGHITLVSHNKHHQPKDIAISRILAMAIVKASIRYNTIK